MTGLEKKYLYLFSEGNGSMRELLGGKGANLAEMTNLGMPVPQGFTITTEACTKYYEDGETISPELEEEIYKYMEKLEELTGKKFGDTKNPLLVSVRSGARAWFGIRQPPKKVPCLSSDESIFEFARHRRRARSEYCPHTESTSATVFSKTRERMPVAPTLPISSLSTSRQQVVYSVFSTSSIATKEV